MKRHVAGLAEYDLDIPESSNRFGAKVVRQARMTDEQLMQIVQTKFARESANLSPDQLFFFPAEISNQNLDAFFTKMAESSLRNYAADASDGVAFQNSHSRELGVGYVINGEYNDTTKAVLTDQYTVRGLKLNATLDTDNFIRGIETGMIRDVSIGFKPGVGYRESCSICGEEFWSYDCRHIPGMMYEVPDNPNADPTNQNATEVMAFVWIENARLSEVSAVYDGATPDAMIMTKAMREQRAGRLSPRVRSLVESRYHIDLHEPRRTFSGLGDQSERPKSDERSNGVMTLEEALELARNAEAAARAAETKASDASERALVAENKLTVEAARADQAEARVAELTGVIRSSAEGVEGIEIADDSTPEDIARAVRSLVDKNLPLAQQTEALRTAEIDNALESGVRAFGDTFDKDKKRTMLEKLDLADIRDQANDWESRATEGGKFNNGRRSLEEGEEPPASVAPTTGVAIPASAYSNI